MSLPYGFPRPDSKFKTLCIISAFISVPLYMYIFSLIYHLNQTIACSMSIFGWLVLEFIILLILLRISKYNKITRNTYLKDIKEKVYGRFVRNKILRHQKLPPVQEWPTIFMVPLPKLTNEDVNVKGRLFYMKPNDEMGEYNPETKEFFPYTNTFKAKKV